MPKDEFDLEDPMELSGVALRTQEDTTDAMCECIIEEFLRMRHGHEQILALFRNPHYVGLNLVLQNRGEEFVRDRIAAIFARWGRPVSWSDATPVPRIPVLSAGARENCRQSVRESKALGVNPVRPAVLPLPEGEGPGAGQEQASHGTTRPQEIECDSTHTDPTGAAIPKINL